MNAMLRNLLLGAAAMGFVVAGYAADHPDWDSKKLISNKLCEICHKKPESGNQHGVWLKGPHANAYKSLASPEAKAVAAKLGIKDPQKSGKCLSCHSTAYGFTEEVVSKKLKVADGVSCQSCHGPGADYKSKDKHGKDPATSYAKLGLLKQTEALCRKCHNEKSPTHKCDRYVKADGTKVDFDFVQALKKIAHPKPGK
jgi:hypothetical protein